MAREQPEAAPVGGRAWAARLRSGQAAVAGGAADREAFRAAAENAAEGTSPPTGHAGAEATPR